MIGKSAIVLALTLYAAAYSQPVVGVLDFSAQGVSQTDADVVRELVQSELVQSRSFNVVDRSNIAAILKEQSFQQTGATDQQNAVEIGKLVNAQFMVYGTLMKLGGAYDISIYMVSVKTGTIVNSSEQKFNDIQEARPAAVKVAHDLSIMKKKVGIRWSPQKTATMAAGTILIIGAIVEGVVAYSRYNTAVDQQRAVDNMPTGSDKTAATEEMTLTFRSSEINRNVGIIAALGATVAYLIGALALPDEAVYEDIPTDTSKNSFKNTGTLSPIRPVHREQPDTTAPRTTIHHPAAASSTKPLLSHDEQLGESIDIKEPEENEEPAEDEEPIANNSPAQPSRFKNYTGFKLTGCFPVGLKYFCNPYYGIDFMKFHVLSKAFVTYGGGGQLSTFTVQNDSTFDFSGPYAYVSGGIFLGDAQSTFVPYVGGGVNIMLNINELGFQVNPGVRGGVMATIGSATKVFVEIQILKAVIETKKDYWSIWKDVKYTESPFEFRLNIGAAW